MVWLCKTKIRWKTKLCSMDSDGFIVYIKTDDIYKDIVEDVGLITRSYESAGLLPKEKNKNLIGLVKNNLGREIMKGKHKFENYKSCLEATQLENKINHLEKIQIDKDSTIVLKKSSIIHTKISINVTNTTNI